MNNKKGRVTRKRCVRKCKKRTSRKLRGSRRYGGGQPSTTDQKSHRRDRDGVPSRARDVISSISKTKTERGVGWKEKNLQEKIGEYNKDIVKLPEGNTIRTWMEKQIPKLETELGGITEYKLQEAIKDLRGITLGNKTPPPQ